nr:unnamed protein product [Callosobruchus chinensis]
MIATEFSQWCARNSLVINPDKTVMMCFGNRCRHSLQISVLVDGIIIDESPVAEFLGTTIDRDLRWSNNIAKICNKINQSYYALLQVKKYLNLNQIINVYYAIIHSHLSYNVVLWGASPSVDRVFVAQKRALRLIFGLTYRESCRQTFHRYKIMPVPCIYIYKCIIGNYAKGERVHVFSFPTDTELRKRWISAVHRENFLPTQNSRVCQLHFEKNNILWESSFYDERMGVRVTAPLKNPRLKPEAVTNIFPNCPSYLTKTIWTTSISAEEKTAHSSKYNPGD